MNITRAMTVAILLVIFGLPFAMAQKAEIRDFPPDFHQYNREALPEDIAPGGELALPLEILGMGGLANGILIKDVVVSNTDKNLKNTNRSRQQRTQHRNQSIKSQRDRHSCLHRRLGSRRAHLAFHQRREHLVAGLDHSQPTRVIVDRMSVRPNS